ncbi:hypothetical protein ELE36_19860 [Pseudolysobacter antarcticus]|uniref:Transposase DDE domain-containing protein n=1 Tax=Pseudolysobacter antarcticus TaxID=2511995 RepID=A0A411HQL9_9GAMM|nr:hypothetical protein ELE36_19860 [Pseudolysobacter antarcticus]
MRVTRITIVAYGAPLAVNRRKALCFSDLRACSQESKGSRALAMAHAQGDRHAHAHTHAHAHAPHVRTRRQRRRPSELRTALRHRRPVFGNLRHNKRLNRFTLRGQSKVDCQSKLFALVHNIEKWANYPSRMMSWAIVRYITAAINHQEQHTDYRHNSEFFHLQLNLQNLCDVFLQYQLLLVD